jgi:PEP-CTERM motif
MFKYTSRSSLVALRFGLVFAIFLARTTEAKAAGITPGVGPEAALSCVFALFSSNEGAQMACVIDPLNTQAFNLDFQFDASILTFTSIQYVSPFTQTTSPDLSQLSSGLIMGIAGATTTPPPGDVDIFEVILTFKNDTFQNTAFTVFGGSNNFVVGQDPSTGQETTFGPDEIIPMTTVVTVPEPSTLILLGTAVFAMAGLFLRNCKRAVVGF